MTRPRPSARIGVVLAILLVAGCAAPYRVERTGPEAAWPPGAPRVRLEGVVALDAGETGARRWFREWAGQSIRERGFGRPHGVAWHGDALVVCDPGAGAIARIDPGRRPSFSGEGVFRSPMDVAVCDAGIVVTDAVAGGVAVLDDRLRLRRWVAEGLSRPTGVACVGDRIFVVETGAHRVVEVGADGELVPIGGRGDGPLEFNFPTAIAVDGRSLLVGDTLNFRVQRVDVDTYRFVGQFGALGDSPGETPRIKGIGVDRRGHVWVSDAVLDRVSLYDRDGSLLLSLGGQGALPGEFSFPTGIAANAEGRIAVIDALNRRIQIFSLVDPDVRGTR